MPSVRGEMDEHTEGTLRVLVLPKAGRSKIHHVPCPDPLDPENTFRHAAIRLMGLKRGEECWNRHSELWTAQDGPDTRLILDLLYREDFAVRDVRPNRHVPVYKGDLLVMCYKYTEPSEEAMERFNERFDEMDEEEEKEFMEKTEYCHFDEYLEIPQVLRAVALFQERRTLDHAFHDMIAKKMGGNLSRPGGAVESNRAHDVFAGIDQSEYHAQNMALQDAALALPRRLRV